jgi:hypothetical protein
MKAARKIRENEKDLILFLLKELNFTSVEYPIGEDVFEYEDGKMGSISFFLPEKNESEPVYNGDLIQVQYIDSDSIPVVITLTKDIQNQLLDLDFWKVDFSKLLKYPKPENIVFQNK